MDPAPSNGYTSEHGAYGADGPDPGKVERYALACALSLDVYAAGEKCGLTTAEIRQLRHDPRVTNAIADRLAAAAELANTVDSAALTGILITRANTPTQLRDITTRRMAEEDLNPDDDIRAMYEEAWAEAPPPPPTPP